MTQECIVPWCDEEAIVQTVVDGKVGFTADHKTDVPVWVWFCREHGPRIGDDV